MPGHSNFKLLPIELDLDLLSTPYEDQTNWHVITGAASCGKSTLVNLLSGKGYKTIPEAARIVMERELSAGRSIEDVHGSAVSLQRLFFDTQLNIENTINTRDVVFLDCSAPGSLAWYRVHGLNPNDILRECFHHRYASVFILDRLPLRLDGLRFEDDSHIDFLDQWLERDYRALGYQVVRVPVMTPEQRMDFVLEKVSDIERLL